MSELREAAQAVVDAKDNPLNSIEDIEQVVERLRAALAKPETEAEPVAWQARHIGRGKPYGEWRTIQWETLGCTDLVPAMVDSMRQRQDYEMRPLYTHPPRDEWREAVHDELVTTWTFSAENKDDPRLALRDIINWHVSVSLDPAISSDAQALIERGKAMRSGWRPASEPPEDGRRVLIWVATESGGETFRPAYCPAGGWTSVFDGETLVAWRDINPPTEGAE